MQVAKPLQRDVPIVSQTIAQTEATANVEVCARVEATVGKIFFIEGTSVKEGAPLFLLDKKPIEKRLAPARGNLGQLEANFGRVTQDVDRLRPLVKSEINGVENMLYMKSVNVADGSMSLSATFDLGTSVNLNQVNVQNRAALAFPRLPESVSREGVSVKTSSPDLLMVIGLVSPRGTYDEVSWCFRCSGFR